MRSARVVSRVIRMTLGLSCGFLGVCPWLVGMVKARKTMSIQRQQCISSESESNILKISPSAVLFQVMKSACNSSTVESWCERIIRNTGR